MSKKTYDCGCQCMELPIGSGQITQIKECENIVFCEYRRPVDGFRAVYREHLNTLENPVCGE